MAGELLGRNNIVTSLRYPMNSLLKRQLDIMANNLKYDFDCIIVIDGEIEGSGKSNLAQQVGFYFADMFKTPWSCAKNIVFSPKQFKDSVLSAPKYSAIVWDEAYIGTSKYRTMSGVNQTIQSLLQQIRQRNLVIVVVLPYFFDLFSYLAVPRSWFLLHVQLKPTGWRGNEEDEMDIDDNFNPLDFSAPVLERGHFQFFSRKRKKQLYFQGKKEYNYNVCRPNFVGMFPKFYTVNEETYKSKKANIQVEEEDKIPESRFIKECLLRGMAVRQFKAHTTCNETTIYRIKKKLLATASDYNSNIQSMIKSSNQNLDKSSDEIEDDKIDKAFE